MRALQRISALCALALVGCVAGNWVMLKNGQPADAAEFRADSYNCEREAARTYPFAPMMSSQGGGSGGSFTNCTRYGNSTDCTTTGGYSAPTITTQDGNAGNRAALYSKCLSILGYQRVFIRKPAAPQPANDSGYVDEKYIVEEGGYCNETPDCVRGLVCTANKCVARSWRIDSAPKKPAW